MPFKDVDAYQNGGDDEKSDSMSDTEKDEDNDLALMTPPRLVAHLHPENLVPPGAFRAGGNINDDDDSFVEYGGDAEALAPPPVFNVNARLVEDDLESDDSGPHDVAGLIVPLSDGVTLSNPDANTSSQTPTSAQPQPPVFSQEVHSSVPSSSPKPSSSTQPQMSAPSSSSLAPLPILGGFPPGMNVTFVFNASFSSPASVSTLVPTREEGCQSPSGGCCVCGEGSLLSNPQGIFEFPGQPPIPCGDLEAIGLAGGIPLDQCAFLEILAAWQCGCTA